ncbi:MAG: MerR family DNA-binding transcriptional regulator, partial [Patescibacteria group bacterium]
MQEKLLTIQEVARSLGVSTKTLRRWDKKGILVPQRTVGNQRRYRREAVDGFRKPKYSSQSKSIISSPVNFGLPRALRADSLGSSFLPSIQSGPSVISESPAVSFASKPLSSLFQTTKPHVDGKPPARTKSSYRAILLGLILICSVFGFAFSIKYG